MQEGEARQCITSVRPDTILIIRRQLPEPVAAGRQSRCMWLTVNYAKQQLEQSATERQLCHTHGDSVLREGGGCAQAGTGIPISGPKIRFPFAICSHARTLTHTHTTWVMSQRVNLTAKIPPSPFEHRASVWDLGLYSVHCWRTQDGASPVSIFLRYYNHNGSWKGNITDLIWGCV